MISIQKILDLLQLNPEKGVKKLQKIKISENLLSYLEIIGNDKKLLKLFLDNLNVDKYTFGILFDRLYFSKTEESIKKIYSTTIICRIPKKYFSFKEIYTLAYMDNSITSETQKALAKRILMKYFQKEYLKKLLEELS